MIKKQNNYKSKSFIPRPSSGSSFRSSNSQFNKTNDSQFELNQQQKTISTKSLMDQLNGAFSQLDVYGQMQNQDEYSLDQQEKPMTQLEKSKKLQKRQLSQISNNPLNGNDILAKAKSLLEKKKDNLNDLKVKQKRQAKFKTQVPKDGAFLTGINVYKEEEPEIELNFKDYDYEEGKNDDEGEEIDVDQYIRNLVGEQKQKEEDYSDIWKLIHAAKKECSEYGEELYNLKNITSETNTQLNTVQRGVGSYRIQEIDSGLEQAVPRGMKQYVFKRNHYSDVYDDSYYSDEEQKKIQSSRKALPKIQKNSSIKALRPKKSSMTNSQV